MDGVDNVWCDLLLIFSQTVGWWVSSLRMFGRTVRALRECPHLKIEIWGTRLWVDAGFCFGESGGDVSAVGASDDVVAVERGFEGDGGEEVLGEVGVEGAEFFEGELVEFASGVEAPVSHSQADGVADDLVGFAEGDAFV